MGVIYDVISSTGSGDGVVDGDRGATVHRRRGGGGVRGGTTTEEAAAAVVAIFSRMQYTKIFYRSERETNFWHTRRRGCRVAGERGVVVENYSAI